MLFVLNYFKHSHIAPHAKVLQYNKALPEMTVTPYGTFKSPRSETNGV